MKASRTTGKRKNSGVATWKIVVLSVLLIAMGGLFYLTTHVKNDMDMEMSALASNVLDKVVEKVSHMSELREAPNDDDAAAAEAAVAHLKAEAKESRAMTDQPVGKRMGPAPRVKPIKGEIPTNGVQPLFGKKHQGGDAIFALAAKYPTLYYQRFVGSLRKFGFDGDIVLAVSTEDKMKPGVADYLKKTDTVAYGFDVECVGKDNCKLQDDFLGYPDPRPTRTFANIRYALYEYWLQYYSEQSYILILDFRDTFFQANPFDSFGAIEKRVPKYDLHLFEENAVVKNIGKCVFNSLWVGRCFGKPALAALKSKPVLCSGSTLGSYQAISHYVRTMLSSMDEVKCWLKGIESDQGYQNYLYYNGHFNVTGGTTTAFPQGQGVVNTVGALNGRRVPKEMKGPLDTFWHARDKEGWIINYDGSRSACVHQWDRWYKDLKGFVDSHVF